jgi:hypothetical protein
MQQRGVFTAHPSTSEACHEDAGSYSGNQHIYIFSPTESKARRIMPFYCMQFDWIHLSCADLIRKISMSYEAFLSWDKLMDKNEFKM